MSEFRHTGKYTCIYCTRTKHADEFLKTEHVVPQAFGRFINNFTLNNKVCDSCNGFFGDNLDIWLARDSYEGLFRFRDGGKAASDYKHMGQASRIRIRLTQGNLAGAYAFLKPDLSNRSQLSVAPLPQIGLRRIDAAGYEFFLLSEFPTKEQLDVRRYDIGHPKAFLVLGTSVDVAVPYFERAGLVFKRGTDTDFTQTLPDGIDVEVISQMTGVVLRAIGKIAFNYLSFWNSTTDMLSPCFDACRNWIRYAEEPKREVISVSDRPILGDEPVVGFRRNGHILTVSSVDDYSRIVSNVSLLNLVTYRVELARGEIPTAARDDHGHFFGLSNQQIVSLKKGVQGTL